MLDKEKIRKAMDLFLCISCDKMLDSNNWASSVIYKSPALTIEKIFFCKDCFDYKEFEEIKFKKIGVYNACLICDKNINFMTAAYLLCFSSKDDMTDDRWIYFHNDCYKDYVGEEFVF